MHAIAAALCSAAVLCRPLCSHLSLIRCAVVSEWLHGFGRLAGWRWWEGSKEMRTPDRLSGWRGGGRARRDLGMHSMSSLSRQLVHSRWILRKAFCAACSDLGMQKRRTLRGHERNHRPRIDAHKTCSGFHMFKTSLLRQKVFTQASPHHLHYHYRNLWYTTELCEKQFEHFWLYFGVSVFGLFSTHLDYIQKAGRALAVIDPCALLFLGGFPMIAVGISPSRSYTNTRTNPIRTPKKTKQTTKEKRGKGEPRPRPAMRDS